MEISAPRGTKDILPAASGHCGTRSGARAQKAPASAQTSTRPTATPSRTDRPPGTCTRSPASATAVVTSGSTSPVIKWPAAAPRGAAAAAGPGMVPFTTAPPTAARSATVAHPLDSA